MGKTSFLLSLGLFVVISSCTKDPSSGGGPTPQPPQPPVGTATPTRTSIAYGEKDTINYSFSNANSVTINGVGMTGTSGRYITAPLTATTTFIVLAQGSGAQLIISVTITVGEDPRITLLKTGIFKRDSLLVKPVDSTDAHWLSAPPGCNTYTFQYNNQTGVAQTGPPYITPNNPQVITNGPCTANPGTTLTTSWGFYPSGQIMTVNGITYNAVFSWHGVFFDKFEIIYDPVTHQAKGFKTHDYGITIWGGVLQNADTWEVYTK